MLLSHGASQTLQQQQQAGTVYGLLSCSNLTISAQGKLMPLYEDVMEMKKEQQP